MEEPLSDADHRGVVVEPSQAARLACLMGLRIAQ